jgi:hypothetical protein
VSITDPLSPLRAIPISEPQFLKIENAAQWLSVADRDAFRNTVADDLRDRELGDGVVTRAIATAFARFYRPLELPPPRLDRPSKLKDEKPIAPKRKRVAARRNIFGQWAVSRRAGVG